MGRRKSAEEAFKTLKVPKCEIFDRSDFHDFYSIKPVWVGDFGANINLLLYFRGELGII